MKQENQLEFSERLHRPERKVSQFFAQELLYDYLLGRLDPDRKVALDKQLDKDVVLREQLEAMRAAQKYLEILGETRIAAIHLEELSSLKTKAEALRSRLSWSRWPNTVRWGAEALFISFAIAVLAINMPWEKFRFPLFKSGPQVTLSEVNKVVSAVETPIIKTEQTQPESAPEVAKNLIDDESEVEPKATKAPATALQGYLYRFTMNVAGSAEKALVIRQKILELGGKKAGQVELGWRKKNPDGNYFHFTLAEENYQTLLAALGELGSVRIFKNKHERVMPEGQIRGILWVEDSTTQIQADDSEPTESTSPSTNSETSIETSSETNSD